MRNHLLTSRMTRKPLKGFYFGDVWVNSCTREEQAALAEEMVRRWNLVPDLFGELEKMRTPDVAQRILDDMVKGLHL